MSICEKCDSTMLLKRRELSHTCRRLENFITSVAKSIGISELLLSMMLAKPKLSQTIVAKIVASEPREFECSLLLIKVSLLVSFYFGQFSDRAANDWLEFEENPTVRNFVASVSHVIDLDNKKFGPIFRKWRKNERVEGFLS